MGIRIKQLLAGFILLGGLLPVQALAVNITVPQATAFGQVLRGNASGNYTPVATSSLGLLGSTSISAVSPLQYVVNTGVFSITQAGIATDGYLSSIDWNTFNNKQATISATWPIVLTGTTLSYAGFGTTTTSGLPVDQILYTNHSGIVITAASSSLSLPNAALQNSSVTVNTKTCTLGSSCTVASTTLLSDQNTYSATLKQTTPYASSTALSVSGYTYLDTSSGNLLIGTTSDNAPFGVTSSINLARNSTNIFNIDSAQAGGITGFGFSAGSQPKWLVNSRNSADTPNDRFEISSASSITLDILQSGNVGIHNRTNPAQALDVNGTIRQTGCTTAGTLSANTSGDIICTSDARLKNILGTSTEGLNAILSITPQRFTYKTTPENPVETFVHAGFIAQDVKAVIPEASALQASGYYSLDTTAITAALVNAVKELNAKIDAQQQEIDELKRKLK